MDVARRDRSAYYCDDDVRRCERREEKRALTFC